MPDQHVDREEDIMRAFATDHEREAFQMGRRAGLAAASWVADGNMPAEHIVRVLAMLDAGDPEAEECLPTRPSLSGEWADAPTPQSLARDILDDRADNDIHGEPVPVYVDEIADAWEAGVTSTFEHECERILRAMAPDES